jgi:hypothetical protein
MIPKQRPSKDSGRVIMTIPGLEEKNDWWQSVITFEP